VDRKLDISDNERYERRAANLKRYPHIVATYFHMKTELYVEYICKGIMGADAYWMRCAQSCHRAANNVSHTLANTAADCFYSPSTPLTLRPNSVQV
jgi:hypothetical protein